MCKHNTNSKKEQDGREEGLQAFFFKNQPAHVDPRLIIMFNLEDGKMELLTKGIIVGSCEVGIKQILFNTYRMGSRKFKAHRHLATGFKTPELIIKNRREYSLHICEKKSFSPSKAWALRFRSIAIAAP